MMDQSMKSNFCGCCVMSTFTYNMRLDLWVRLKKPQSHSMEVRLHTVRNQHVNWMIGMTSSEPMLEYRLIWFGMLHNPTVAEYSFLRRGHFQSSTNVHLHSNENRLVISLEYADRRYRSSSYARDALNFIRQLYARDLVCSAGDLGSATNLSNIRPIQEGLLSQRYCNFNASSLTTPKSFSNS